MLWLFDQYWDQWGFNECVGQRRKTPQQPLSGSWKNVVAGEIYFCRLNN